MLPTMKNARRERSIILEAKNILVAALILVIIFLLFNNNDSSTPWTSSSARIRLKPTDFPSAIARYHFDTDPLIVPKNANNLEEFLAELKSALDMRQLTSRPVNLIFNDSSYFVDMPHPACEGLWLEFGVYTGATLNMSAQYRERFCGENSGSVFGFDTFTGLPENWAGSFAQGAFSLNGELPYVRHNIELVKGLFSDSLPGWMAQQRKLHGGVFPPVTYLHIDCDLYAGSKDALTILKENIAPGCLLLFDELLHYPEYREHEVKALWEYLQTTGRKLEVVGVKGPMSPYHLDEAVDLNLTVHQQNSWMYQSVAFIVI